MHKSHDNREAFEAAVEHLIEANAYAAMVSESGETAETSITRLWRCTDTLPSLLADQVEDLLGAKLRTRSYGAAAQAISRLYKLSGVVAANGEEAAA